MFGHLSRCVSNKKAIRVGLLPNDSHTILIVEDEALIRDHAVTIIRDAGYQVVEAANADEAIGILEKRLDITIVFTDVQMPGSMDGLKLAEAIRGRWPPIKIIATSGNVNVGLSDLPDGGRFVKKPYTREHIIAAILDVAA